MVESVGLYVGTPELRTARTIVPSTYPCSTLVSALIIECRELDWKCVFTGLKCTRLSQTLGVELYNFPLWAYTGSRLIQQCKR